MGEAQHLREAMLAAARRVAQPPGDAVERGLPRLRERLAANQPTPAWRIDDAPRPGIRWAWWAIGAAAAVVLGLLALSPYSLEEASVRSGAAAPYEAGASGSAAMPTEHRKHSRPGAPARADAAPPAGPASISTLAPPGPPTPASARSGAAEPPQATDRRPAARRNPKRAGATSTARPAEAPQPVPGAGSAESTTDVAGETRLLTRAHRALEAGQLGRATTLLERYRTRFPGGVLRPEAMALRILIACRRGDATQRAQAFLARHPGSPQAARIRRACANTKPAPTDGSPSRHP